MLDGIKKVDASINSFKRQVTSVDLGLTSVQMAFSSFGGVAANFKAALDLGGKLSDLSATSGATAGEMLVLPQAMVNPGMGSEAVGGVVAKLQKALAGVNEDGPSTADVFTKLGLNSPALSNMSLPEQFAALAGAFQRIEDPARRAPLAMALFGRSGAELLPLLRDAGAGGRGRGAVSETGWR